jgi:acyl carrier protein
MGETILRIIAEYLNISIDNLELDLYLKDDLYLNDEDIENIFEEVEEEYDVNIEKNTELKKVSDLIDYINEYL